MVISSFISSILVLALGIWAYLRLEPAMNSFAERQLIIEPSKFSFKMWKDMPVSMYQSFTFFNLTNWSQVKSLGQKPRFVEVGPYVYRTVWSKSDVNFLDDEKLVSFAEKKQWHFQAHLSRGYEDDLIWTINTPLMTALALIQNAPVITRNIVGVILDGLGEGAFIKRPIRALLFEGYSDLIVSVGPLFDRRFANFNGKFAYLYNKNDTIDGHWTVSTGQDDLANLNKISRFQSSIVNMTSFSSGQMPQGLNEVKAECAPAWSLDQSTNGQLFAPFNRDIEQAKLQRQLQQLKARALDKQQQAEQQQQQPGASGSGPNARLGQQLSALSSRPSDSIVQAPKRFFSRISSSVGASSSSASGSSGSQTLDARHHHHPTYQYDQMQQQQQQQQQASSSIQDKLQQQLKDFGKYIFYPDLCRPIHLLPAKQQVTSDNGIQASRYHIDPRVFMNSSQMATNKCYEMNPRPPLANALAATINSVTGASMNVPNLVTSASSPFALFIPPNNNNHHNHHHHHGSSHHHHHGNHQHHDNSGGGGGIGAGLFERANHPSSFLNNALHSLSATANQAADQLASSSTNSAISRLGRVRQLFSNIVSQRMSANPLLPSLAGGPANLLMGGGSGSGNSASNNHLQLAARSASGQPGVNDQLLAGNSPSAMGASPMGRQQHHASLAGLVGQDQQNQLASGATGSSGLSPMASNNLDSFQGGALGPAQAAALEAGANQPALGVSPSPLQQQQQPALPMQQPPLLSSPLTGPVSPPAGGSDRWVTQFRFKWPRGVFSIGQCQLGAPIYVSLPHFLDADEYYLEQVEGLKPNRSLHEFYIDVESTLHSIPVGAKARLQLNVATPELRFRNIPNAMIPVLWQEVTFKIDKPIATMLYWSFTMSSTLYKLAAVALILAGLALLVYSFVGGFRSRQNRRRCLLSPGSCSGSSSGAGAATTSSVNGGAGPHRVCPTTLDGGRHRHRIRSRHLDQHHLDQHHDQISCASSSGSHLSDTICASGESSPHRLHHHSHNHHHHNHHLKRGTTNGNTIYHHQHSSQHRAGGQNKHPLTSSTTTTNTNQSATLVRQQLEGRRSSWQHLILHGAAKHCATLIQRQTETGHNQKQPNRKQRSGLCIESSENNNNSKRIDPMIEDDELLHGASLNRAYASSCNEIHRLDRRSSSRDSCSGGPAGSDESITTNQLSLSSPKQPAWSRASSHCELVSSFGTITKAGINSGGAVVGSNCNGCLFACLRHSPNGHKEAGSCLGAVHQHQDQSLVVTCTSDMNNRVVRQQQQQQQPSLAETTTNTNTTTTTTSDIEKATLSSSRSSNLDSCSSIYTTRISRKFKS